MKVAVLSESSGDEVGLSIIVGGILEHAVENVPRPPLRSRGWPSVRGVLPSVIKQLHYHSDAQWLVVVVDSDESPVHRLEHVPADGAERGCRLCQLKRIAERALLEVTDVPGRRPLKLALGVAVPAIEAWYCCGVDGRVTEAAWVTGLDSGHLPYTKNELKKAVYGTDRPSSTLQEERARQEAERLIAQGLLRRLQLDFPNTFGALGRDLTT